MYLFCMFIALLFHVIKYQSPIIIHFFTDSIFKTINFIALYRNQHEFQHKIKHNQMIRKINQYTENSNDPKTKSSR